jgi:hypothetical protein
MCRHGGKVVLAPGTRDSDSGDQPLKERVFVKNRSTATANNPGRSCVDGICRGPRGRSKAKLDLKTGRDSDSSLRECTPFLGTNEVGFLSTGLRYPFATFEISLPLISEDDEVNIGVHSSRAPNPRTHGSDTFDVGLLTRPLAYCRKDRFILGEPRCVAHASESCRVPGHWDASVGALDDRPFHGRCGARPVRPTFKLPASVQ